MIRKLKSGEYRLYSRKRLRRFVQWTNRALRDPKTGKRRNLCTFASRAAAEKCGAGPSGGRTEHAFEREVQYFKRH